MADVLLRTDLPLSVFITGKVRDTFYLGDYLMIVATDRISAFDVVLPNGIPQKGAVLSQISAFWFRLTENIVPNHLREMITDIHHLDDYVPVNKRFNYPQYLAGRTMIVKKAKRIPVECVVRGYLAGSAWAEYSNSRTVCGISLPPGLKESEELPEPIFTPTTKADSGHDLPLTMPEMAGKVGKSLAEEMKQKSLQIYKFARNYAKSSGIIIADTKFEFGTDDEQLIVIDEMLTPDSSRFWDEKYYTVGQSQPSYDKQPVRDWLTKIGWNKEPPAPALPVEVVKKTTESYRHVYQSLTGKELA